MVDPYSEYGLSLNATLQFLSAMMTLFLTAASGGEVKAKLQTVDVKLNAILHKLDTTVMAHQNCQNALRAVPEIILGGAHFFFRPLHIQDTHGVRAPRPPGHVSALINPPHYGSNMPWPPGQVTPHPPPLEHTVNNPPHRTKSVCAPPPRIISGTALSCPSKLWVLLSSWRKFSKMVPQTSTW